MNGGFSILCASLQGKEHLLNQYCMPTLVVTDMI